MRSTPTPLGGLDYAIIQLDRPVTEDRRPAPIHPAEWPVAVGSRLHMVGATAGLPAKLDSGGVVARSERGAEPIDFLATVDAFSGSSGAPVFDQDLALVGVLSGGNDDYVLSEGCARVARAEGAQGERVTYAGPALAELCALGHPSEALCGVRRDLPATWTCDPLFWGATDGCDCNCGAYDVDCNDPELEVFNCRSGEVCDPQGGCAPGPEHPADAGLSDAGAHTDAERGAEGCGVTPPAPGHGAALVVLLLLALSARSRTRVGEAWSDPPSPSGATDLEEGSGGQGLDPFR